MNDEIKEAILNRFNEELNKIERDEEYNNEYGEGYWDGILKAEAIIENEF